jgi:hypothetical protein
MYDIYSDSKMECTSFQLPVPNGIYYGQNENLDSLNRNLYERNIPDMTAKSMLKPNMDARSVPTRNTVYPVYDQRTRYKKSYLDYSPESSFAPLQSNAPPSGYKVNIESSLRNQYFSLQHGAEQGVYVPSSDSDLYKVRVSSDSHPDPQPFANLFAFPRMTTEPPPLANKIGVETFNNCTQTQLRNATELYSFS